MENALTQGNATQDLCKMLGSVDSLHRYLLHKALKNAASKYYEEPLDDDLQMVCIIMGFEDILAIKKEDSDGKRSLNFADD